MNQAGVGGVVRKGFTDQMTCEQRTKGREGASCAKIWDVPAAISGKGTGLETCFLKDIRKPGRCSQRGTVDLA